MSLDIVALQINHLIFALSLFHFLSLKDSWGIEEFLLLFFPQLWFTSLSTLFPSFMPREIWTCFCEYCPTKQMWIDLVHVWLFQVFWWKTSRELRMLSSVTHCHCLFVGQVFSPDHYEQMSKLVWNCGTISTARFKCFFLILSCVLLAPSVFIMGYYKMPLLVWFSSNIYSDVENVRSIRWGQLFTMWSLS